MLPLVAVMVIPVSSPESSRRIWRFRCPTHAPIHGVAAARSWCCFWFGKLWSVSFSRGIKSRHKNKRQTPLVPTIRLCKLETRVRPRMEICDIGLCARPCHISRVWACLRPSKNKTAAPITGVRIAIGSIQDEIVVMRRGEVPCSRSAEIPSAHILAVKIRVLRTGITSSYASGLRVRNIRRFAKKRDGGFDIGGIHNGNSTRGRLRWLTLVFTNRCRWDQQSREHEKAE